MALAVMNMALIVVWPFSRRRINDSSHMIAFVNALKACILVMRIFWLLMTTRVPVDLVFTSGRVRRPKTPPGPAISSSMDDMVAATGPVLVTLESIDMMKELDVLLAKLELGHSWKGDLLAGSICDLDQRNFEHRSINDVLRNCVHCACSFSERCIIKKITIRDDNWKYRSRGTFIDSLIRVYLLLPGISGIIPRSHVIPRLTFIQLICKPCDIAIIQIHERARSIESANEEHCIMLVIGEFAGDLHDQALISNCVVRNVWAGVAL